MNSTDFPCITNKWHTAVGILYHYGAFTVLSVYTEPKAILEIHMVHRLVKIQGYFQENGERLLHAPPSVCITAVDTSWVDSCSKEGLRNIYVKLRRLLDGQRDV